MCVSLSLCVYESERERERGERKEWGDREREKEVHLASGKPRNVREDQGPEFGAREVAHPEVRDHRRERVVGNLPLHDH